MRRPVRRLGRVLTAILVLSTVRVAADPVHVVTEEPRLICVPPAPSSTCRDLPPGHFVDQDSWSKLDTELRRSQNSETSLKAQNQSLRDQMSGWSPGWKTITVAVVVGLAGGVYLGSHL